MLPTRPTTFASWRSSHWRPMCTRRVRRSSTGSTPGCASRRSRPTPTSRGRRPGLGHLVRRRMARIGLEHVRLLETDGHPAVYADWLHAGLRRPCSCTATTTSSPSIRSTRGSPRRSSPTVRDGQLFARGAVDDKGQVLYHLEVVRALLRPRRAPTGQPQVPRRGRGGGRQPPLRRRCSSASAARLAADVIVVSDTAMWSPGVPSMCAGMRGLVAFYVALRTAIRSTSTPGSFGGAVRNAAHDAAAVAPALHDDARRVSDSGLLRRRAAGDRRRPRHDRLAAVRPGRVPRHRATEPPLAGESGFSTLERIWVRPTAEITGIAVGLRGVRREDDRARRRPRSRSRSAWCPTRIPTRSLSVHGLAPRTKVPDGLAVTCHPRGRGRAGADPVRTTRRCRRRPGWSSGSGVRRPLHARGRLRSRGGARPRARGPGRVPRGRAPRRPDPRTERAHRARPALEGHPRRRRALVRARCGRVPRSPVPSPREQC